jgi:hypothetical protein
MNNRSNKWAHFSDADFLRRAEEICRGKAPYPNRQTATAMLRRAKFQGTPYKCGICGEWHNTTLDKNSIRAFQRRLSRILRQPIPEPVSHASPSRQ